NAPWRCWIHRITGTPLNWRIFYATMLTCCGNLVELPRPRSWKHASKPQNRRLRPANREANSSSLSTLLPLLLLRWFYADQRAVVFIRQDVHQTVGSLADVPDTLAEIAEQRLPGSLVPVCIEADPLQVRIALRGASQHRAH